MTSWQDEPPTSRRALRESERKHVQALLAAEDDTDDGESGSDQRIWRRPISPEPLNYVTQGRAPAPDPEPKPRRARSENPPPPAEENAPYRLRDFSPESRGSAFTATRPKPPMPWTPPSAGSGDLDYHTAVDANRPQPTPLGAPADSPPNLGTAGIGDSDTDQTSLDESHIPSDVTMTRRELRAIRNAAATQVDHRTRVADESAEKTPSNPEPDAEFEAVGSEAPETAEPELADPELADPESATADSWTTDSWAPEPVTTDSGTTESTAPEAIVSEPVAIAPSPQESPEGNASFDLVQPEPLSSQAPKPEASAELLAAMVEFDALYRDRVADPEPAVDEQVNVAPAIDEPVLDEPVLEEPVLAETELAEPVLNETVGDEPAFNEDWLEHPAFDEPELHEPELHEPALHEPELDESAFDAAGLGGSASFEPVLDEPTAEPTPSQLTTAGPPLASEQVVDLPAAPPDPATAATIEPGVAVPVAETPSREFVTAPEVYAPPTGHWSTQAGIDDKDQTADHPMSRDLSAIDAITTNALVLPNFPTSGSFTGPVGHTGEILITGSFDLPSSVSVTGAHPSRYDSADVDLLDKSDREDAAPDSAPVRAIRAVSTHTSSQGLIATKRPRGNNLPVILSITAGVMMVGVVVLVVAGMVFKIF